MLGAQARALSGKTTYETPERKLSSEFRSHAQISMSLSRQETVPALPRVLGSPGPSSRSMFQEKSSSYMFQGTRFKTHVSEDVFQETCYKKRMSGNMFHETCLKKHVPANVFQETCFRKLVSRHMFQETCFKHHVSGISYHYR